MKLLISLINLKYKLIELKHKLALKIAYLLPLRIVYWASIRAASIYTTSVGSKEKYYDVKSYSVNKFLLSKLGE